MRWSKVSSLATASRAYCSTASECSSSWKVICGGSSMVDSHQEEKQAPRLTAAASVPGLDRSRELAPSQKRPARRTRDGVSGTDGPGDGFGHSILGAGKLGRAKRYPWPSCAP